MKVLSGEVWVDAPEGALFVKNDDGTFDRARLHGNKLLDASGKERGRIFEEINANS